MKKIFFALAMLMSFAGLKAQTVAELRANANAFMRQGDHDNAILILNRAQEMEPDNFLVLQDLAMNYYFNKTNNKALELLLPLLDRPEANDQTFQLAGNIYKLQKNFKDADKVYRKGLKRFPDSGSLYNDYGTLLWANNDMKGAIAQFENGIQRDPNYAENYLNAAYYYADKGNLAWPMVYGEMYVNMNPNGPETPGVKQMLLNAYKKFFNDTNTGKWSEAEKSAFGKAVLKTLEKQSSITAMGLDPETLTMIRTRFILDWYNDRNNNLFPFKLFDIQQQLLRDNLFQAYNQWLFGPTQNLETYKAWVDANKENYDKFITLQKQRLFKVPTGQYYYRQ